MVAFENGAKTRRGCVEWSERQMLEGLAAVGLIRIIIYFTDYHYYFLIFLMYVSTEESKEHTIPVILSSNSVHKYFLVRTYDLFLVFNKSNRE